MGRPASPESPTNARSQDKGDNNRPDSATAEDVNDVGDQRGPADDEIFSRVK